MAREYKDSGIEWIGQIPKEWEVNKINRLFGTIGSGTTPTSTDNDAYIGQINWIQSGDLNGGVLRGVKNRISEDTLSKYSALTVYKSPFIIIAMYGASVGNISISTIDGCCNQACCVLCKSNINFKYAFYTIKSSQRYLVYKAVGGGQPNISQNTLKHLWIPVPNLQEQQKIADYLDKVCGEVDEMVTLQETMIEELKAYKQSVITEAVTKGLNPNVPMKDSGIDWIGEVPEHWEIRRIKNLFTLRDEKNYKPMDEVQLLSLYTGIGVFPHGEQEERGNKAITVEGYKVVHKDDIVVNIILAWMGAIGVSNYDGVTSPAYDVYIPDLSKVIPHFFHYVFRTQGIAGECYKYGRGIMMMRWRTYSSEFKQIRVPYPSLKEQQSIASYLDTKCAEIDALIAIKQSKIEELKEYKKSVIYEYVTGKKEVV